MKNGIHHSGPRLTRRSLIQAGAWGYAASFLASCRILPDSFFRSSDAAGREKERGLLHNEDCTDIFVGQTFPPGQAGETIDRYVDVLAEAGVNTLMVNTNGRRTNYRSDVWESFWDGYDPAGPENQPFFLEVPAERRERFRKMIHNMWAVHAQGVDYPARVIRRCRQRGIRPWISLRMNDVHNSKNLKHPFHGAIFRRPELFLRGHRGYFANGLDYAHAEVREHYLALIRETLERYDIDGLELDFLREPYLFSVGREREGQQILTDWIRGVRSLAERTGRRRGHDVRLGVRVPSCPETADALGLDAPLWAREKLIDRVVAAPRWATLEFAMPLRQWRERLGETVTLAGGLEVLYRATPNDIGRQVTREEATGAAVAVLSEGADAVYLFNYFQRGWPAGTYRDMLRAFGSPEELLRRPRRHAVTYRDVKAPHESYHPPLPAGGAHLTFTLPLGPRPAPDWRVEASIGIVTKSAFPPSLSLNGIQGTLNKTREQAEYTRLVTYSMPVSAVLGKGEDVISVRAGDANLLKVTSVEIALFPDPPK